jgi:hypothetical protein
VYYLMGVVFRLKCGAGLLAQNVAASTPLEVNRDGVPIRIRHLQIVSIMWLECVPL